jgi:adenylate cyclase
MKRILLILTISCSLLTIHCSAQLEGQALTDSLLKELPGLKQDSNMVNVLCAITREYSNINPDEGLKYGERALKLATKLGWKKGMALANKNTGLCYLSKHDLDKAMDIVRTALKLYTEIGNTEGMSRVCGVIGIIYQQQPNYPKALEYDSIAIKIAEDAGDKVSVARNSGNIAGIYLELNDWAHALKYYDKALKIFAEVGDKKNGANMTGNIGIVYKYQSDYTKSTEYYQKALKLNEELGNSVGIAAITANIADNFKDQGDHAKALEYLLKALRMDEELGLKQYQAVVTGSIAHIYLLQNDLPKSLEYLLKSLKIGEELKDKSQIARTLDNIGNTYIALHNSPVALEHLGRSLKLHEEIGDKHGISNAASNIGVVHSNEGNNTMAIDYLEYSLKIARELNDRNLMSANLSAIGMIYVNLVKNPPANNAKLDNVKGFNEHLSGKYRRIKSIPTSRAALLRGAISYLESALALAKETNLSERLRVCYEELEIAYSLNGDYRKALEASSNFHAIRDSVFSKDNNEKIIKIGMKDEYERQRLIDSLKTVEKEKIASINLQKQRSYTYLGIAGIMLLAGFSFFILKERGKSETARKQSDELLLNILPTQVAEELKANGTTTAKHYDNVTVLFTDFVNFTQAAEQMSAQGLIDELHACFKIFDEITSKYNIEKIKTIGDAYLAVCGLPTADPKHAENVVRAATEINTFMQDRLAKMGSERTFKVRIGIHSGSVVAGIVGVKKFAYDIWGDTVNTAARMEQHGEAGKINISQTTYELVKDKFTCEYRGKVEAKGKGVMRMYFVS